ncbi:MAG: hypothetical protein U0796_03605 [Gemmatales bacterium]
MVIENPIDVKPLIYGLAGVLVLYVATLLFPVYVDNNESSRAFRWNAPVKTTPRAVDRMTPAEIQQWENDPMRKDLWEAMKAQPPSVPLEPVYMGEFFGVGFNWLGWLTLLAFVALLGYAAFRGYILYKIKMDEMKKPKKKRDLPLMVRRRGEKKRYGTYGS